MFYQCDFCATTFETVPGLVLHFKFIHAHALKLEDLPRCHYCNKLCVASCLLKEHIATKHGFENAMTNLSLI